MENLRLLIGVPPILLVLFPLWLLPVFIARKRGHASSTADAAVTVLAGWIPIVWIFMLLRSVFGPVGQDKYLDGPSPTVEPSQSPPATPVAAILPSAHLATEASPPEPASSSPAPPRPQDKSAVSTVETMPRAAASGRAHRMAEAFDLLEAALSSREPVDLIVRGWSLDQMDAVAGAARYVLTEQMGKMPGRGMTYPHRLRCVEIVTVCQDRTNELTGGEHGPAFRWRFRLRLLREIKDRADLWYPT
jgi:hypothetical protein